MQIYRIHIDNELSSHSQLVLGKEDTNYLINVVRAKIGHIVHLFNATNGEFKAKLVEATNKKVVLEVMDRLIPPPAKKQNYSELIFAPIKHDNMYFMIEKATELGVDIFTPIITERTIVREFNFEKYKKIAIQASEQCGRLTIPHFNPQTDLSNFLDQNNDTVLFAYEKSDRPIKSIVNSDNKFYKSIIGAEGGFTDLETKMLRTSQNIIEVSLGENTLRAETAAISILTIMNLINEKN